MSWKEFRKNASAEQRKQRNKRKKEKRQQKPDWQARQAERKQKYDASLKASKQPDLPPPQRKKVTINEDVVLCHKYNKDAPSGGASVDSLKAIYDADNNWDPRDSDEDSDVSHHSFPGKYKRIRLNVAGRKKTKKNKKSPKTGNLKDDSLWEDEPRDKIRPNIQIELDDDAPLSDENSDEPVKPILRGIKSKRIQEKINEEFNDDDLSNSSAQFDMNAFSAGETIEMNVDESFLVHMMGIFPRQFSSSREGVPYDKRIGSLISAFSKNRQKRDSTIKHWINDFETNVKANLPLQGNETFWAFSFLKSVKHQPQRPHKDFTNEEIRSGYGNRTWIGFVPLTQVGMSIEIWPKLGMKSSVVGSVVEIPYGKSLWMKANTVHAGGFKMRHEYEFERLVVYASELAIPIDNKTNIYDLNGMPLGNTHHHSEDAILY